MNPVIQLSDTRRLCPLLLLIGAVFVAGPAAASPPSFQNDLGVVGVVGTESLTEGQIVAADQPDFAKLDTDLHRGLQQLRFKYAKLRYDMVARQAEKMLDQRAVEAEAKSRGVSSAAVLKAMPPAAAVTDAETHEFYEAHKDRISQPFEQVALQIRLYLAKQHDEAATRSFYDSLRIRHGITSTLVPFTVSVDATGPARGPVGAPVTIVEFGDFQCPFCKQAESTLHSILESYPQKVRVVFRNLPLTELHPNAEMAARAGICADRQQHFWLMHDAMYGDQKQLNVDGLKMTAAHLGMDEARFADCLQAASTDAALAFDMRAADELGISETPFFFINGQPVDGSLPLEQFRKLIDAELARLEAQGRQRVARN